MTSGSLSLLFDASRVLFLSQQGLASLLDSSLRTIQRVQAGQSSLSRDQWATLARAVYPRDPDLAARLAASQLATLEQFGIAPPPTAAAPPGQAAERRDIDSLLCAAADAMNGPPRAVRPIVTAAFVRARDMGLTVEAVAAALLVSENAEKPAIGPAQGPAPTENQPT